MNQVKATSNGPKALIIEPSKELAEQTLNNVKQFKKYVDNPKLRYEATLESISMHTTACDCSFDQQMETVASLMVSDSAGNFW